MAENNSTQKKFPPYSPEAYFGGNLLLGGLSYILLRQYKRFFICLGLVILSVFIPLLRYIVMIGSAIDAYLISKKLIAHQIPEPPYNKVLTGVAIAIWVISNVAGIALLIWGSFLI